MVLEDCVKHSIFARSGGGALGRALFYSVQFEHRFFNAMQYIDLPLPKSKMWCIIENTNTCLIFGEGER